MSIYLKRLDERSRYVKLIDELRSISLRQLKAKFKEVKLKWLLNLIDLSYYLCLTMLV